MEISTTAQSTPEMEGLDTTVFGGFVDSVYGVEAAALGLIVLVLNWQQLSATQDWPSGHLINFDQSINTKQESIPLDRGPFPHSTSGHGWTC
jgi:hypothetical protein